MVWDEQQIETRETLVTYFTRQLRTQLTKVNTAFRFLRIDTPILEDGRLRQGTVQGAYAAAKEILTGQIEVKYRLPIVVWQHGKVFRGKTGDLQEFYSLDYHILYSKTTAMQYQPIVQKTAVIMLQKQCGLVAANADLIRSNLTGELLAEVFDRSDFWGGWDLELAVNMDACIRAFMQQEKDIAA